MPQVDSPSPQPRSAATSHPLRGLLTTQFLGAFNDNAWKYMIITLALRPIMDAGSGSSETFNQQSQWQATVALLVFTLPMILFSLPAAALADRFSKRSLMIAMKLVETGLMTAAAATLLLLPASLTGPLVVLGLMGVQSALFSPAKYGILPEILPHEKLSSGNGLLEMWTMVAIIAGTGLGPVLLGVFDHGGTAPDRTWLAAVVLVVLAGLGAWTALQIPRVPAAGGSGRMGSSLAGAIRAIRRDRALLLAIGGAVFYWTVLSLLGQNVYVYTRAITADLASPELVSGIPLALFGVGVGLGAVLAGRLSENKIETGLIPLGSLVFAFFTLLLGAIQPAIVGTNILVTCVGIGGGLVIVPLHALIQWLSPADRRGAVIAVTNVVTLTGVVAGSLAAFGLASTSSDFGVLLLACAACVIAGTAWAVWLLPDALIRLGLFLLTHTFYRLKVVGRTHVPETGPALLVPNHMALIDGLLIHACLDRPIHFLVHSDYYNKWWAKPFMKALGAMEIAAEGGPRVVLQALRRAGEYLDRGDLVCIFPEGQISRTGSLLGFRGGMTRILKGREVPVVPVYLDRVWGSVFSHEGGRIFARWPRQVPYPVTVSFGRPLSARLPLWQVRQAVQELSTEAWTHRRGHRPPLHRSFRRAARRKPRAWAIGDQHRPDMSRGQVLVAAIALARDLRGAWRNQRRVGILLPPSVAGVLVNLAAALAGRSAVNINFTAGTEAIHSAVKQAGLSTVITSRTFGEKIHVDLPAAVQVLEIEDLLERIGRAEKFAAIALALVAPAPWLERACGAQRGARLEDEATVIFSSGSTGLPKGVCLTHANVDANIEATAQVFRALPNDRLLGILPLFHSFGYMTSWFALNHGIGVMFHPNPLDGAAVGRLVSEKRLTLLIATPTFLQLYLRRCEPGQLGSVRVLLTGAERLTPRLADAFEQRFGIRPMEGYGSTECSPIVALNTSDVRSAGIYQAGSRRGSVGRPLPGVSVRIVDPAAVEGAATIDDLPPLTPGEDGMILVKGPNVMQGYLGREDLTADAIRQGWYVTGDLGRMDEDGFLTIGDRLSRFSKIGGEMVPHGRVEEVLHEAAGSDRQAFAVTSVPDERKGERLVVLHTIDPDQVAGLLVKLKEAGLPNLFIPRADQFVQVPEIPFLGTGKLDLRKIREIARETLKG